MIVSLATTLRNGLETDSHLCSSQEHLWIVYDRLINYENVRLTCRCSNQLRSARNTEYLGTHAERNCRRIRC